MSQSQPKKRFKQTPIFQFIFVFSNFTSQLETTKQREQSQQSEQIDEIDEFYKTQFQQHIYFQKMGVFIKFLLSVIKFISIICVLNYLTPNISPLVQSILVQDYIKDENIDKQVIPFSGLLLIQKTSILAMAYLAIFLQNKIKKLLTSKGIITDDQNKTQPISTQQPSQTSTLTTQLKYQIVIGISAFLSTYLFSQIQDKLQAKYISYSKHASAFGVFVIIHIWFISKSSVMKVEFSNWFYKLVYIGYKCYLFYYFANSLQIIIFNTKLWVYYYTNLYMQFVNFDFNISNQTMGIVGIAFLFELAYYVGLCLLKNKHPNISTFKILISMMKFTIISTAVYALFNGELLETLSYLINYPQGWGMLTQYCTYSFVIYLLLAYSIVSYPPSLFLSIILLRGAFEDFSKQLENQEYKYYWTIIAKILAVWVFELIIYSRFQERQRLKSYNRIKEEKIDEITDDRLDPNMNEDSQFTSINRNIQGSLNENRKSQVAFTEESIEPSNNQESEFTHINQNTQSNFNKKTQIMQ